MEKNGLNKLKFPAKGIAAFIVFWLLVGSFLLIFQTCTSALDPPPAIGVTPVDTGVYIGQNEGRFALGLASLQFRYGSFNTYVPILGWWNREGFFLLVSQKDTNGVPYFKPVDTASQWRVAADSEHQMYMLRLAKNGFGLQQRLYQFETATENVWGRYAEGHGFIYNDDFYVGGDGTITKYAESYYNVWLAWSITGGSGEGDGGGNQIIVNELDIGSIISSLPQAARNILDSTFGFELFGINIAATLTAVLLISIVAFVVKWLMSR